jgi:hypothetical protein
LVVGSEFAVTEINILSETEMIEIGIFTIIDSVGICAAGQSRTKVIITLAGGLWLGQVDLDIGPIINENYREVQLSATFPYAALLNDACQISHDDFVATIHADFINNVRESNESNNDRAFTFSINTDSICL